MVVHAESAAGIPVTEILTLACDSQTFIGRDHRSLDANVESVGKRRKLSGAVLAAEHTVDKCRRIERLVTRHVVPVVENEIVGYAGTGAEFVMLAPFEAPCTVRCLDNEEIVEVGRLTLCLKSELPHVGTYKAHFHGLACIARSERGSRAAKIHALAPVGVVIDVESNFHEFML